MSNTFIKTLKIKSSVIEAALDKYTSNIANTPQILVDAMQYSLKAGGKRLRPALVMMTAESFGLKPTKVLPFACAVEMIHTYSLIHDDLPCMDNDSLRRGKPTSHKIFGEDAALLAGDGLLTYAFETALKNAKFTGCENTLKALEVLARSAGADGMVGGQVSDIYAEGLTKTKSKRTAPLLNKKYFKNKKLEFFLLAKNIKLTKENLLLYIHTHKTAELIKASVRSGAVLAGVKGSDLKHITEYGGYIGLAFQITDDILDAVSDAKTLGKSNSDDKLKKLTFVTLYGLENARNKAEKTIERAKKSLDKIKSANKKIKVLYDLADFILERSF